ncbi:putative membrane protein [Mycobacterium ulcerans str. Harvey]|uniref:Membrane protein n=1 Tax=Mycobacterium ulcerans str. Harvey TaxID=1299332 RepID=A0ABP3A0E8_MYCUL|nr:putative membrane protein [Mycobacterium ulcerans str. Harvey]
MGGVQTDAGKGVGQPHLVTGVCGVGVIVSLVGGWSGRVGV